MTLRLILTRHAKSSWDDLSLDDHDRVLNARGRASAQAIGSWLAENHYLPDQVLVSSAARTQETWAQIATRLPAPPKPDIRGGLYLSGPDQMLGFLKAASGQVVMLIAHNPGSAYLAEALAVAPPADARFQKYPTGATTIFEFAADHWASIGWGAGNISRFIVPRDLLPST